MFVNMISYLTNRPWEFQQIYSLVQLGTKVNRLDFEVKRSKIKVMTHRIWTEKSTFGFLKILHSNI